jgi:hypothetical protein
MVTLSIPGRRKVACPLTITQMRSRAKAACPAIHGLPWEWCAQGRSATLDPGPQGRSEQRTRHHVVAAMQLHHADVAAPNSMAAMIGAGFILMATLARLRTDIQMLIS